MIFANKKQRDYKNVTMGFYIWQNNWKNTELPIFSFQVCTNTIFSQRLERDAANRGAQCVEFLGEMDAAYFKPDAKPEGIPIVKNGISLCKLHHAAFDAYFLGIRPDYVIEIRKDLLDEEDGPMLIHGVKDLNNRKIILPSPGTLSPDRELLERRYEEFRSI